MILAYDFSESVFNLVVEGDAKKSLTLILH